ncbi:MAG: 3'-5' exonuclease [Candidatus Bipolaricaulia bacterium]
MEFASITVCNTSPGSRSFSIHVESDVGFRATPQPSSVILGPGECTRVVIHPATYELYSVDLETSGLDPRDCSIIEVAWMHSRCGEITQTYSSLVHLEGELNPYVTWLTGITSEMLKTAPASEEVIPRVLEQLSGNHVLYYSQNQFDQRFLEAAAVSLGLAMPGIQWINVLSWARRVLRDLPDHRLETVTEALGIEGQHHRALSDALMTQRVFLEVVRRLGSSLLVSILPEDTVFPVAAVSLPVDSSFLSCDE